MNLFDNEKEREELDWQIASIRPPDPVDDYDDWDDGTDYRRVAKLRRRYRAIGKLIKAIFILAIIGAIAAGVYLLWERPPKPAATMETPVPPVQEPLPDEEELPPSPTPDPGRSPKTPRNDGVYTFLLVGLDLESDSTDTILVGRFDTNTHEMNVVNIPRDTLINISWGNTPKKINTVYPGYKNSGLEGADGLLQHITKLLGFRVDCYAIVSLEVVEQVIDEIGGVWFNVPVDMDYEDPAQGLSIHMHHGYQKLDGAKALGVFRYRSGYPGGDIQRISVQQELMKAIAAEAISLGNIPNLPEIAEMIAGSVETDLDAANIAYFARQALKCDPENISFETMPFAAMYDINGVSFVEIDIAAWLKLVNAKLNPFESPVSRENTDILTYDGQNFSSTLGYINGGENSFFCAWCRGSHGANLCPNRWGAN